MCFILLQNFDFDHFIPCISASFKNLFQFWSIIIQDDECVLTVLDGVFQCLVDFSLTLEAHAKQKQITVDKEAEEMLGISENALNFLAS